MIESWLFSWGLMQVSDNTACGKKNEKSQKLWTGVYPLRITPIFSIFGQNWSSWRDLSFGTYFVICNVFSCRGHSRAVVGRCSVGHRTAVLWSSDGCFRTKILISKFQISIGQGWGTAVPLLPSEPSRPSPGQLKLEICVRAIDRTSDRSIDQRSTIDELPFSFFWATVPATGGTLTY